LLLANVGVLAAAGPDPASIVAPAFKAGDRWVFEEAVERGPTGFHQQKLDFVIERVNGASMLVGIKPDGAPTAYEEHVTGPDWSQRQLVDGQEQSTMRPLNFPMKVGQSWTVDFKDNIRRGQQVSLHVHRTFKVIGWEDVSVPAGTFHALKIESSGADEAVRVVPARAVAGTASSPLGGTTFGSVQPGGMVQVKVQSHGELYYVPSVKNWVKSVDEQYDTQEVLTYRSTQSLVSFQPAA